VKGKPITDELWREYEFGEPVHVYRIADPRELFIGNTTHRVVDAAGVVHCVPAVGHFGCVLRWMPRDGSNPVQF
jgi:hypothetical protein